jgi:hypothetical protein
MRAIVATEAERVPTERKTGLSATASPPRLGLIDDDWVVVLAA